MVWMSPNMEMSTSGGGLGKMFSKAFSGESMFQNIYTARGAGMITFGSSFPGRILPLTIQPGQDVILQKTAFLAAETGVNLSVHFNKKMGSGFFGGEGFIMQRLSGSGVAFAEVDGELVEEIALDKVGASYSFTVEDGAGGSNTILVEQGRIRVSEANCPDQVCVGQGWISDGTVPIVCLPHGLVIEITGGGEDLDAAAG